MILVRVLLFPFSLLYGLITSVRNLFFNIGILKSTSFKTPSISVGNLTVGGTGKTPHIEYLIRLLEDQFKIATLSRGYKRKTKGFILANEESTYKTIGDEPMQFHTKFNQINVAVDEKRRRGMQELEKLIQPDIVLLDDCFQHRWIKPSLNIVLIDYSSVGDSQFMLPTGNLRESKSGQKRADIIIVSKSPQVYSPIEHRRIKELIKPQSHQKTFFSFIKYLNIKPFNDAAKHLEQNEKFDLINYKAFVFAGIANVSPLIDHLQKKSKDVITTEFGDHYAFNPADIVRLTNEFKSIISADKLIITTEKDAMRLKDEKLFPLLEEFPVFYIPIEIGFHKVNDEEFTFDQTILEHVQQN